MLVASSECDTWRYEVLETADGYLVQQREIDSGELSPENATVFRTATVAFAYTRMCVAAEDLAAAEEDADAPDDTLAEVFEASQRFYVDLCGRLADSGTTVEMIVAHEQAQARRDARHYN